MYKVRVVKTGNTESVQVISYINRKTVVVKHIGSVNTRKTLADLKALATEFIKNKSHLINLFEEKRNSAIIDITKTQLIKTEINFIYEKLSEKYELLGLKEFPRFLKDISIMRIIEPSSKLEAVELLEDYFGIEYSKTTLHRKLSSINKYKDQITENIINFAKTEYNFDFKIVFYDVTTLYFESFKNDELRKAGFSKDHKHNQPQILIGLIVSKEGFPVSYQIYEGNKFEGHTMLPSILDLKEKHKVENLTVVADAAMISEANINLLNGNKLNFIVGARLGNINKNLIDQITENLNQEDLKTTRIKTKYGNLICQFSKKRYNKDKHELEKLKRKAEDQINNPSKIVRRTKYLKISKSTIELNEDLLEKNKKLLGIKGYYTNLTNITDEEIINQYHNLWKIEKAFRISKSDLQIRPVFHFIKTSIEAHILICFIALAISKHLELKTALSIKRLIKNMKRVRDAVLLNQITNETHVLRMEIPEDLKSI